MFLDTDEEPVGVAIASPAAQPVVHGLAAELVGRDPRAVRGLHELMQRLAFKGGPGGRGRKRHRGARLRALGPAREAERGPAVARARGATPDRVAAYASGLDMPLSDDELRTYYRDMAERHGITAGKLKVGRDPERDLERLAIMRDALHGGLGRPRDPSLMIDANEFWSPKQAIRRIAEIERDFDLVWAEEPVRRDDHRGLARVSRGVRTAVATGENLTAVGQFVPLLIHEAADVIQVAVQGTGVTAALRIFEMADAFGLPVALVNSPGRYAAHVGTVLPNHLMMEVIDPGPDAVFTTDDRLEDGSIVLGEAPGLGITFDEDAAGAACRRPAIRRTRSDRRYRRAPDSGISEPGIPLRRDDTGRDAV